MYHLVLCFAVALLCSCRAASVNQHLKLLPNAASSLKSNGLPTKLRDNLVLLKRPSAEYELTPGSVVELTCEAGGSPVPSIHWFKNNEPIYGHDSEPIEPFAVNQQSLGRIASTLLVTKTDGEDKYSCVASTGKKSTSASTQVYGNGIIPDISERVKLLPLAPRIVVKYRELFDMIGTSVYLPCRARGYPRPSITWRDNNGTIVENNERIKVHKSGGLEISSLLWSDMGVYSCTATNKFGNDTASTFLYPVKNE